jgi:hypothetical protein
MTRNLIKAQILQSVNLTPAKIEDLAILGKVWGFLKYYHPAIAKGDYNWDYELFRILPEVLQCKSDKERNEILSKWILSLGEVTIETHGKIEDSAIKSLPIIPGLIIHCWGKS